MRQFRGIGGAQAVKVRIQWSHAGIVDARGIHEGCIQLAGASIVVFDDVMNQFFCFIAQRVEGAIHTAIIWDNVIFYPRSVD